MTPVEIENWDFERYSEELAAATAKIDSLQDGPEAVARIQQITAHFPKPQRLAAFAVLLSMQSRTALRAHEMDLKQVQADQHELRDHEREIRTFYTGIALLLVSLVASGLLRQKDHSTEVILRVTAAVGVGLAVAFLPGFFAIDGKLNHATAKLVFRSTGAFAALIMVYFFDPGWFSSILHR